MIILNPYRFSSGSFSAEYQAVLDFATANTITIPSDQQNIQNDRIVRGLVDLGVWDVLDLFYLCGQESGREEFARLNYIDPANYELEQNTPSLVPDFIAGAGFKHSADNKYYNTRFRPDTDATHQTADDAAIMFKLFDFPTTYTGANRIFGGRSGTGAKEINIGNNGSGTLLARFNGGSHAMNFSNQTDINGHFLIDRNGVDQTNYLNSVATNTGLSLGTSALSDKLQHFLGLNNNGVANAIGTGGIEYLMFGGSFRSVQSDVYDLMQTAGAVNDIVVEMGQSNMEGRDGDTTNGDYPFESANGYYYDGSSQSNITTTRGNAVNGSHANYFCEKYFALTGKKAVMIEVANGGAGLTSTAQSNPNNWSSTGSLRSTVETRVNAALTFYGKTAPKYALWCQGERDAQEIDSNSSYTKALSKTGMQNVIDWWQTTYPNVPFIISELGV